MEREVYNTRVVPLVRYEKRMKNGKQYEEVIDNLTGAEISGMSCEPKMLKRNEEHVYIEDVPLTFRGGTGIRGFLCYVFDDLNEEEQKKYFNRSIVIRTTIKSKTENTKKTFFGRVKKK